MQHRTLIRYAIRDSLGRFTGLYGFRFVSTHTTLDTAHGPGGLAAWSLAQLAILALTFYYVWS